MSSPNGFKYRRFNGITLIELMLVVAIVGILSVIAIPTYRGYSMRAHRTEAKDALLSMLTNQERFRLVKHTYTSDLAALGFRFGCSDNCVYTLDFTVAPDTSRFTARARPTTDGGTNGVDQTRDAACQWFTITQSGSRDAGPGRDCW